MLVSNGFISKSTGTNILLLTKDFINREALHYIYS